MARSKSQPRSKSQTRRSKSKTRKSISKSPGRNRKIQSPKSEPKKRSVSRGRPAKTPKRSVSPKKSKTQAKTPTKTAVIQRSASRSSSRSRVQTPKTPSVLSAPVSAIKRQSRSLVKKASEIPTKVQRLVLERSKSPKKAIGWCQGVTNNVCRKVQITYNGLRYRFNRACRYVKANQTDIFWTLVMLAFIGLLFYVFYYKGTKFDPAFKYVKDQYHRGSKYITTHYHNIRDHFYKK